MQSDVINTVKISKYICNPRSNIKRLFFLKLIFYFNEFVISYPLMNTLMNMLTPETSITSYIKY